MKDRITWLLKTEDLTPSRLAEMTGVQPSAISHIVSGRNNPGYEFITKLLLKFPHVNPRWLLLGEEPIYIKENEARVPDNRRSFIPPIDISHIDENTKDIDTKEQSGIPFIPLTSISDGLIDNTMQKDPSTPLQENHRDSNLTGDISAPKISIEKIVVLYNDGTFKEYIKN